MTRLVQIQNSSTRRVPLVDEPRLRLLDSVTSILQLAQEAVDEKRPLTELIQEKVTDQLLDYDPIYHSQSPWRLLGYAIQEGAKFSVELLTATATLKQFQSAIAQGHGEKDIAAVVETFRKN